MVPPPKCSTAKKKVSKPSRPGTLSRRAKKVGIAIAINVEVGDEVSREIVVRQRMRVVPIAVRDPKPTGQSITRHNSGMPAAWVNFEMPQKGHTFKVSHVQWRKIQGLVGYSPTLSFTSRFVELIDRTEALAVTRISGKTSTSLRRATGL